MSKNRHLAIYPQPQFHDILFSSKELSPLTLTEVDSFRSCSFTVLSFHPFHPHSILGLAMWKILSSNDVEVIA